MKTEEKIIAGFRLFGEQDLLTLVVSVLLFWLLICAGRGLLGKKAHLPILPLCSLTSVYFFFVLGSVLSPGFSVFIPFFLLLILACVGLLRVPIGLTLSDMGYSVLGLLILSPLIWLALVINQAQWDDYTHWLVSARYLFKAGHLPVSEIPVLNHSTPSYPWARAMLHAWVNSQISDFSFKIQPLFNLLFASSLLMWAPVFLTHVLETVSLKQKLASIAAYSWLIVMLILCVGSNAMMSSYADPIYAMCVVHLFHLMCFSAITNSAFFQGKSKLEPSILLLIAAPLTLKSSGIYFSIILIFLFWLYQVGHALQKDGTLDWRRISQQLLIHLMYLAPAIVLYYLWSYYVERENIKLTFTLQPIENWHLDILPSIIMSMFKEMASRPYTYIAAIITSVILLVRWRYRKIQNHDSSVFLFIGIGFFFATLFFQLLVYCVSFGEGEAARAASFNRYMTPAGLVMWMTLFVCLVEQIRFISVRKQLVKGLFSLFAFLAVVIVSDEKLASKQRFSNTVITEATRLGQTLPQGSTLLFIDLLGNGFIPTVMRFYLDDRVKAKYVSTYSYSGRITPRMLADWSDGYDYVYFVSIPEYVANFVRLDRRLMPAFYLRMVE